MCAMLSGAPPELFIVSSRYGDELRAVCAAAGWTVRLIRKPEEALRCYRSDTAPVVLVDARGALLPGIDVARDLADAVEMRRGAMLMLLSRSDDGAVGAAYDAGATRVLVSPFTHSRLIEAVRFAQRATERLAAAAAGKVIVAEAVPRRDVLTGLATAAYAQGWVELLLGKPTGGAPPVIVLQIAIGRFGQFNAAYGSQVADALLQSVAARLKRVAAADHGEMRLVARLAGAEFAVMLAGPVSLTEAQRIAQQLAAAFEAPFSAGGRQVHLGCRIGIALGEASPHDPAAATATVFQRASAALVAARANAPGTVEVFQDVPGRPPLEHMADLEADLRTTLDAGKFDILFQPQIEFATGTIVGVEALVRWQHPALGQLSAETLLEVAQSAEVAIRLGGQIQRQALGAAANWPIPLRGLRLSVNVTAADLASAAFLNRLDDALALSGFPASQLTLELTESDLIENLAGAAAVLAAVRERGVQVALDDFGTGYSSLAYLRALPLDSLKIDKRLIADLTGTPRARVVVKGVIDMARALGLCVVAEGIETDEQRAAAAAAGCDWYQGFLCAPPLTTQELIILMLGDARRTG